MTSNIFNVALNENIVQYAAEYILSLNKTADLSSVAVLMPSKRPALFIKKEISKIMRKSFVPPAFFTFDELVNKISSCCIGVKNISSIDSAYTIYNIVKNNVPEFYNDKYSFSGFFQWSYEILNFIDSVDVEKIDDSKLLNVKLNADIGYDLPKNINDLLKHLYVIRQEFHKKLDLTNKTTRGYSYYNADKYISQYLKEYKRIILFNPYYLNKSETDMFKKIYSEGRFDIIIKGDKKNWTALEKIYNDFNFINTNKVKDIVNGNIKFYCAYDGQSQACLVKNLISGLPKDDIKDTVVIVPDNSILQSVMSELYSIEKDINIAVGYPAKKTTVFSLMNDLIQAQKNKKNNKYYVKNVLAILSNPLVKNMRFIGNPDITRIIVHEIIKNFDRFNEKDLFQGHMFILLEQIQNSTPLHSAISKKVSDYWEFVSPDKIRDIITEMFDIFFYRFECAQTTADFGKSIKNVADNIADKSLIKTYPFNLGAVNILYDIAGQFTNAVCAAEMFGQKEILSILENVLLQGNINLAGSPLKGLQVLGLMESRGLNFKNVYVLSMSDSIVPAVVESSHLIPKDIANSLGIGYAGRDIDIQKYHFMSLIAGAKNVSLIYAEGANNTKSRFIEELIWQQQFKEKSLKASCIIKAVMPGKTVPANSLEFVKTDKIKELLAKMNYSATSVDTYMECKLKFYYKYVLKLSKQMDYDNDYESIDIGNCIHDFFKEIFHKGLVKESIIHAEFKNKYDKTLDIFLDKYFKEKETGKTFLLKKLIMKRMNMFYENEIKSERNFKEILKTEFEIAAPIIVNNKIYNLKSKIDRIDANSDGTIAIIDYKTGNIENPLNSKALYGKTDYTREIISNNIRSFQLIIYKYLYEKKFNRSVDNCMLYSLKNFEFKYLFKQKDDKRETYHYCIEQLKYIIADINAAGSFKREPYDKTDCEKCCYFFLCR